MSFPSDLDIARSVTPRPIVDIAAELGHPRRRARAVRADQGQGDARRDHPARGRAAARASTSSSRRSRPTPLGEGKSTTTVGLAQGLNRIGHRASVNIRQPSLGPVFGIKGGAARRRLQPGHPDGGLQPPPDRRRPRHRGGPQPGRRVHRQQPPPQEPARHRPARRCSGRASLDISDRALRHVVVGLGGREDGVPRETEFVITVASEVMAVLALATDLHDLRARLGRIVLATRVDGTPVTADDLGVAGAMTVLLRDAIKPNLLQTLEGGPAFVHCGPFAQHRPRQQLDHRRPARARHERDRLHGGGLRGRHGRREVLRHQVPGVRAGPGCGRRGRHGPGAQDARRRRQDRGRQAARPGPARGERRGGPDRGVEPRRAHRDRPQVRHPGGRRHQRVPDRHAGRGRGDPRGRARGGRARRRRRHPLRRTAGRARRRWPRRSGRPPRTRRAASGCSIPTRRRSARRSRRSRPRSTARTAST